jgi:hypothetical protein
LEAVIFWSKYYMKTASQTHSDDLYFNVLLVKPLLQSAALWQASLPLSFLRLRPCPALSLSLCFVQRYCFQLPRQNKFLFACAQPVWGQCLHWPKDHSLTHFLGCHGKNEVGQLSYWCHHSPGRASGDSGHLKINPMWWMMTCVLGRVRRGKGLLGASCLRRGTCMVWRVKLDEDFLSRERAQAQRGHGCGEAPEW